MRVFEYEPEEIFSGFGIRRLMNEGFECKPA